jgi:hypothetical protein
MHQLPAALEDVWMRGHQRDDRVCHCLFIELELYRGRSSERRIRRGHGFTWKGLLDRALSHRQASEQ